MLPPDLAAFSFSLDAEGADDALAARAAAAAGDGRIAVLGAQRWGLLRALARRSRDVVALEPSRTALATVRVALEHAGVAGRVTLLAADPRDFDLPDGADAFLVPSPFWRSIVQRESRASSLGCILRALRPGGALLLDLDRPPVDGPSGTDGPLRSGPARQTWTWRRSPSPGVATVGCVSPGVAPLEIDVALLAPEAAADEVRAAGFATVVARDAATGSPVAPSSPRAWIVASPPERRA